MGKYTKHNSNYIKTSVHQYLKDGSTIFERDWVTVGSQLNFGPNKIPYYRDGNFIFTTSQFPYYQKKHKNGVTVATWTYKDVKDATSDINQIKSDEYTEDIRSYVYYGSCVELLRTSIENILKTFPGNITLSEEFIDGYKILNNPFDINIYTKDVNITKDDNELRYLTYSRDKYLLNFEPITSYDVITRRLYEKRNGNEVEYQMFADDEKEEGWILSGCVMKEWLPNGNNNPVYTVTINGNVIEGYIYEENLISLVKSSVTTLIIQPNDEVIEEYFSNLEGFEKQLLTRKTKPNYTNRFVTPIEYDLGYVYYKRTYTWPSTGYCIDINTPNYFEFISKLSNTAALLDELSTDNLWRRMTHEAIKNYDWTYTREYNEGDEQDNIEGGERMHKVLNIISRVFDDIKRNIDTIKHRNRLTYDGDRNMPNALLSDRLELNGWDVYSTIPSYEDDNGNIVSASNDTIIYETDDDEWYETLDKKHMTFSDVDIDFERRLALSSRRIFETKGTKQSIDMVMGMFGYGNLYEDDLNYEIKEEYYTVIPKNYDEDNFGDDIVYLNGKKTSELLYADDVSGIPVGSFIGEYNDEGEPVTYLIPFYDQRKTYDGYMYFQSKGGWLYNSKGEDEISQYNWTETLSYLHVVPYVSTLLEINPFSLRNGDIYYVVNMTDYIQYSEEVPKSRFFKLNNDLFPEEFSSWENIDLEDGGEDARKANYLNDIIPYTNGNNPHVGYGEYDKGNEYIEYMKQPFKYSIDTNGFVDYEDNEKAKNITFDIKPNTDNVDNDEPIVDDKVVIFADRDGIEEQKYDIVKNTVSEGDSDRTWGILDYKTYNSDKIKKLLKRKYYLNSKVIYFKNKIENDNYKLYFRNVIIKYLMQVIPSTAIIMLENFELESEKRTHYTVQWYDDEDNG